MARLTAILFTQRRRIYLWPSFSNTCACGTLRSFPFVHIVLEEFDYTARVQHVLHTTGCN